MRIVVTVELEVNIDEDRANANEIFQAVAEARHEAGEKLARSIVLGYQEFVVGLLCSPSGSAAKKGLGAHEVKGVEGRRCRCRTFTRAGYWTDTRSLQGSCGLVTFHPALVECVRCGKRLTPLIAALERSPWPALRGWLPADTGEATPEAGPAAAETTAGLPGPASSSGGTSAGGSGWRRPPP